MVIKNVKKFDYSILIYLFLLLFFGILSIYSAATVRSGDGFHTNDIYLKQIIWSVFSLMILVIILVIPFHVVEIAIVPAYVIANLLLIIVLFLPPINGAHRWIVLGPVHIQPSEFAKISSILMLAKVLSKENLPDLKIILYTALIILPVFFLISLQPDMGTALTLIFIGLVIMSVSDLQTIWFVLMVSPLISMLLSFFTPLFVLFMAALIIYLYKSRLSVIGIMFSTIFNSFIFLITPIFWNQLKVYQQERILTFLDPSRDPFGAGYQIIQAKIAIGSGGMFGKGFLEGTQKNLHFLPEHHTDFIFSVIGEEFGFFGCTILLLFYFLFLFRIAMSIKYLKSRELRYSAVGILAYITFQFLINIGMNIGIMPITGIPLPFISYGGSNLVVNMISVGLIMKFLLERSIFE